MSDLISDSFEFERIKNYIHLISSSFEFERIKTTFSSVPWNHWNQSLSVLSSKGIRKTDFGSIQVLLILKLLELGKEWVPRN